MRGYKTEGIILKRVNFGETDRLLTVFTKHDGKIKALAKGIRQVKSRKAGNLELFNQVIVYLASGRNFEIITEAALVNGFTCQKESLAWVSLAFEVSEVTDRLTAERVANRRIFDQLRHTLVNLTPKTVHQYAIFLLKELGFGLPKNLSPSSVERYIEKIIEKKLTSRSIFITGY